MIISTLAVVSFALFITAGADGQDDAGRYLERARAYADTMMEKGRDRWGEHTPLFTSILDRREHDLFHKDKPLRHAKAGLSYAKGMSNERVWDGANIVDDNEFYDLMYRLSKELETPRYEKAADASLRYFWKNCTDPNSGLAAWGEHMGWHLPYDTYYSGFPAPVFEDKWFEHFPRCYRMGPEVRRAIERHARGIWRWGIGDHEKFKLNRHMKIYRFPGSAAPAKAKYPRLLSGWTRLWAYVRAHTEDEALRLELRRALGSVLDRMLRIRVNGGIWPGVGSALNQQAWLLRHLYHAEQQLPQELAEKARSVRMGVRDVLVKELDHPMTVHETFLGSVDPQTLEVTPRQGHYAVPSGEAASFATHLLAYGELAGDEGAVDLAMQAARLHLRLEEPHYRSNPSAGSIAPRLRLMVRAYDRTGKEAYLKRAKRYADDGIEMLLDDRSALPKSSKRNGRMYESSTSSDNFMLGLFELHRVIQGKDPGHYGLGSNA